jgi:hypothetical protein
LFEDEFSLSNTATVHYQWGKKGKQPTISCKQRQRERQTAMGSYNFDTGQMTVTFHQKGNYQSFKRHLKKILKIYRHHSKIIMVVDLYNKNRKHKRSSVFFIIMHFRKNNKDPVNPGLLFRIIFWPLKLHNPPVYR